METATKILEVLSALIGAGLSLWGAWYLITGLMSWRRPMDYGRHPARTRFAVLIAARNEQEVIGPLVDSLLRQDTRKSCMMCGSSPTTAPTTPPGPPEPQGPG